MPRFSADKTQISKAVWQASCHSRERACFVIRVCAWDNLKERRLIPSLFVQRFQCRISSSRCLSTTPWQDGPAGVTAHLTVAGTQRQGKIRGTFLTSLSRVYTNTHCLLLGLTSLGLHHLMVWHGPSAPLPSGSVSDPEASTELKLNPCCQLKTLHIDTGLGLCPQACVFEIPFKRFYSGEF